MAGFELSGAGRGWFGVGKTEWGWFDAIVCVFLAPEAVADVTVLLFTCGCLYHTL